MAGNVAATAHQNGSVRSASNPNKANAIQKIFFSMSSAYASKDEPTRKPVRIRQQGKQKREAAFRYVPF